MKETNICVDTCKGICCDPWWGIIFYALKTKRGGGKGFRKELIDSIRQRVKRIKSRYVTSEIPPRELFKEPERYNVNIEDVNADGGGLLVKLRAMFAFRCVFLSPDKTCSIHPSVMGVDIRPPHCEELGSLGIKSGHKGYCRIIEASVSGTDVMDALKLERDTSEKYYNEGFSTVEEAAERVLSQFKGFCSKSADMPVKIGKIPGRNEPCHCGSAKKYKFCHGR